MRRSRLRLIPVAVLVIALGAVGTLLAINMFKSDDGPPEISGSEPARGQPGLKVEKVIDNLDHPWDIDFLPDGTLVLTERPGKISLILKGSKVTFAMPTDIDATGECGLMGLAVDPEYNSNKYIYTCLNSTYGTIRIARWVVDQEKGTLKSRQDIVDDIPSADSGRHSGCQLAFGPDGNLWVGTGDSADESQPQNKDSLGGKILRVDREGKGVDGNITDGDARVFSYGHRNTQGMALYETVDSGSYGISVEHGPSRDDEINPLKAGNFGWAPGSAYDESADMTDTVRFPDAIKSIWSSGSSTIAVSGADFLEGDKWRDWQGYLAVGVLKDKHIRLFQIKNDMVADEAKLYQDDYGRIRAVKLGLDQSLYFTTDNGDDDDAVYRVTPS